MATGRSPGWTRDPARRSAHELAQFLMTSWEQEASLVPTVDGAAEALGRDRDEVLGASRLLADEGMLEVRQGPSVGGDRLVLTRRGSREVRQVWRRTSDAERQRDVREALLDWLEERRTAPLSDFATDPRAAVYGVPVSAREAGRAVDRLVRQGLAAVRGEAPDGAPVVASAAGRASAGSAARRASVRPGAGSAGREGPGGRRVLLLHGRDDEARRSLTELLKAFGLEVVSRREAADQAGGGTPYAGDVVAAGLRLADAVVVLMTPDDVGYARPGLRDADDGPEELEPAGRPRLDVVFEAGMAAALARRRTVLVEVGAVRGLTATAGLDVIRMNDTVKRRRDLAARLGAAGLAVDLENDGWRTAGSFRPPPLTPADLRPASPYPDT